MTRRFDRRDGAPEHRPSMRRAAVLLVLAFLASVVVDAAPRAALGNHGGREVGSLFTCDRPVSPPRCTSVGDGLTHRVAFDASLTDGLADSLRQAMAEAYDEPTKLRMIVESTTSQGHRCDRLLRRLWRERGCGLGLLPHRRTAGPEPVGRPMVPSSGDPLQPQSAVRALLRRRRQSRSRDLPRARAHARPPSLGQSARRPMVRTSPRHA